MPSAYLIVKLVHIISATLLFGTGLGTAFFMLSAYRSADPRALAVTSRHVVTADWLFTLPAVAVQLGTGLWLTVYLGIPLTSAWFVAVLTLFAIVGLCWIPVVVIQIRIRALARVLKSGRAKAVRFSTLERLCEILDCQPGDLLAFEAESERAG